MNTWREIAKPIIARVLQEYPGDSNEQKAALRESYPFGERRYWPYKVWLDEIQRQKGLKETKRKVVEPMAGQTSFLGGHEA